MSIPVRALQAFVMFLLPLSALAATADCPPGGGMEPPRYPPQMAVKGVGGESVLILHLDACGRPLEVQVEVSSGYPEFDEAAVAAARGWQIKPPQDGIQHVRIPVRFDPNLLKPPTDAQIDFGNLPPLSALAATSDCPPAGAMKPPIYPPELAARGLGGESVLILHLDACGRPLDVKVEVSAGHPALDEAAVAAARGWQITPPKEGVQLVRIPIKFDPNMLKPLTNAEIELARLQWQRSQVPVVPLQADGLLPWNMPDPLPLQGSVAELLAMLEREAEQLPLESEGRRRFILNGEDGRTNWEYFPQSFWAFGPALIRLRQVSDGQKGYVVVASLSEADEEGQRLMKQMVSSQGTQQPFAPAPPPPQL